MMADVGMVQWAFLAQHFSSIFWCAKSVRHVDFLFESMRVVLCFCF